MDDAFGQRVPVQVARGCVVAGIQVDLSPGLLKRLQADVLETLAASGARGVIIGLGGVELMDSQDFQALRNTASMARLMGARTVLVGMRPAVVASLVELGVDTTGLEATLDLDEAFRMLSNGVGQQDASPDVGEGEAGERQADEHADRD